MMDYRHDGRSQMTEPEVMLVPLAAPRGRSRWTFRHGGRAYVVFALEGQLRVADAACPHRGGPLAKGILRDGSITCPWHWYCFDLQTGRCRTDASYALRLYPVIWRDGRALAVLPTAVRPRRWSRLLRLRIRAGREAKPPG
jgi:nitrite reductase/ring-hydroxylating ferredoxin subunit